MKFGDRCHTTVGATGRYIGYGLALAVSAQDNDLFIAHSVGYPAPHPTLPVPTDEEMAVVARVIEEADDALKGSPEALAMRLMRSI